MSEEQKNKLIDSLYDLLVKQIDAAKTDLDNKDLNYAIYNNVELLRNL